MFTSDIKNFQKTAFIYLFITIGCIIFTRIYYQYSHNVMSNYMTFMYLYPFLGGSFLFFLLHLCKKKTFNRISYRFYHFAISTLTVGSIIQGVLEIAGATCNYVVLYKFVGLLFLFLSILLEGLTLLKTS